MTPFTWPEIAARLEPARNYWVACAGPDGTPHASPVWGVVLDGALIFYTGVSTVKARYLRADPRLVVHLESGDDVLIVRGTVDETADPDDVRAVQAAFAAKYTDPDDIPYLPVGPPREVVFTVRPTSATAWELDEFDTSQRRWSAAASGTTPRRSP
jgi:hypothetical protein